jgi:hypothetical protein
MGPFERRRLTAKNFVFIIVNYNGKILGGDGTFLKAALNNDGTTPQLGIIKHDQYIYICIGINTDPYICIYISINMYRY